MRWVFMMLVLSPTWAQAADAKRGGLVAQVRCMPCHHLHRPSRSIGPSLHGIFGSVPTITGVPFAIWDADSLNAWLTGPRLIKPNTRMRIPPIAARDRTDLIAYFKAVRSEMTTRHPSGEPRMDANKRE